jgi:uncharacterized protein YndB with AHSA1/START domain
MTTTELEMISPADVPEIRTRRFVKATPETLFALWTEPDHLRNWWGPRRLELAVCEVDLRVGGTWRFVSRAPDGQEFAFHGEYLEIDAPSRLVSTWVYEGAPDADAVETVTFEAVDGGTMVHGLSRYPSVAARDGHLEAGMESGMTESYERMDEIVAGIGA